MVHHEGLDYRLKIGPADIDFHQLAFGEYYFERRRGLLDLVPFGEMVLWRTRDSRHVLTGDRVAFWWRSPEGKAWGEAVFSGHVSARSVLIEPPRTRVRFRGPLGKLEGFPVRDEKFGEGPGPLDLEAELKRWAARSLERVPGLFDGVDVEVTPPPVLPPNIYVEEGDGLSFLRALRKFTALHVSVTTHEDGYRVLSIRDEVTPDKWHDLSPEDQERRTFEFFGPDELTPTGQYAELLELAEDDAPATGSVVVVSGDGEVSAGEGPPVAYIDLPWADRATAAKYADLALGSVLLRRISGRAILRNVERGRDGWPMDPNDLIYIRSTRAGLDRPLAVQAVRWFGAGSSVAVRVTWTSKVPAVFVPASMPGGPLARVEAGTVQAGDDLGRLRALLRGYDEPGAYTAI